MKLCELQRNNKRFVLSLRPHTLHRISGKSHFEFIFVYPVHTEADNTVAFTVLREFFGQVGFIQLRFVNKPNPFIIIRNEAVNLLKHWNKAFNKLFALRVNVVSVQPHLLFPNLIKRFVGHIFILQQCITLFESMVILNQCVEVLIVVL